MGSPLATPAPWYRSTWTLALAGSILLWSALPPLALGWLAWIAPVPWLLLVRSEQLAGRRPYGAIYLAGLAFWLATLHFLRLPHPALVPLWFLLAAYLACYLPVFIGLSRVAVHCVGVPLWLAAPIVWTGLELARAHLFTGFLLASLAHTQVQWPIVIQVSDLVGEYGVGFLVMMVAAAIACAAFPPRRPWATIPAGLLLFAVLVYGNTKLREHEERTGLSAAAEATFRIALIQGNSLAEWKQDPNRVSDIMDEYIALSQKAVAIAGQQGDGRPIDLVVWPETMFRTALISFDPGYRLPPQSTQTAEQIASYGPSDLASLVKRLGTAVMVGIVRAHFTMNAASDGEPAPPRRFNSVVLVDAEGRIIGTYDKVHRVMFGEYIPLAEWLPFVYRWTPLTGGIHAGREPAILELNGWLFAPSICYETVLPHVIRRQAAMLVGGSVSPDVLVNVTNDAWYWGSNALDLHLACGVFRAVETRKPLVIAANGGLSAWIDAQGRIRAQSPRQKTDVIIADVARGRFRSWYTEFGDWFAAACLTCCVVLAIIGWTDRRKRAKKLDQEQGKTPI